MISIAMIVTWQARRNASGSSSPATGAPLGPAFDVSGRWNLRRFKDARLHAESSSNMYSEHGLDALIRDVLMHGRQSLIVVSYWMPGSPQIHAASAFLAFSSRARGASCVWALVTGRVCHSASRCTEEMKSSVTRTEWLAFW